MANSRYYSSTAQQTTLTSGINNLATTIDVASTLGFPGTTPYLLALDYGGASEELVLVTGVGGLSLTVTRAYDGTSATSHNTGAAVRHVTSAIDFTDSRTHEASSSGVHGISGAFVDTTSVQTLSNKTLTSPTINGGAMSGTFTGAHIYSGAVTLSGGGTLTGTFAGSPAFSGTPTFSAGAVLSGSYSGAPKFIVKVTSSRAGATDTAIGTIFNEPTNTFDSWQVLANGRQEWGSGTGARDTFLYRNSAGELKTDGAFTVGLGLTSGSLTTGAVSASTGTFSGAVTGTSFTASGVGEILFERKTADTPRTTATRTDDPDLTFSVAANAVYEVTGMLNWYTTDDSTADIAADWTVPSGATGKWAGIGQPAGATSTDGTVRTVASDIDALRNYGALTDSSNPLTIIVHALLVTTNAGTYALNWARTGGSGTLTLTQHSFIKLLRVA